MATITLDSGATLQVADLLFDFMRDEALTGSDWTPEEVFRLLGRLVEEFEPRNRELLAQRDAVQRQIDNYYIAKRAGGWRPTQETAATDALDLEKFLVEIGYLETRQDNGFTMTTPQLDPEMDQNGPELVTPVTNASMAVGGANARWGSLYDAYYLSDIHPEIDRQTQQPARLKNGGNGDQPFLGPIRRPVGQRSVLRRHPLLQSSAGQPGKIRAKGIDLRRG